VSQESGNLDAFRAAPGTLISVPQLRDPNFLRSVVAMLIHNDDGALGVVVNHITEHTCSEVLREQFDIDWENDAEAPLLRGGPVDQDGLWMLHDDRHVFDDSIVATDFFVTSWSPEALATLCTRPNERLLLGVGVAGWGPGQLEREIAEGAWVNGEVSPELLYEWPREDVWERALRELGIDPALLVSGGGMQ